MIKCESTERDGAGAFFHYKTIITMALILCPECGRQISDQAITCPHCGRPMTQNANDMIGTTYSTSTGSSTATAATEPTSAYPEPAPKRRSIWPFAVLSVIVGLVILMFVTCPNENSHRQEVHQLGEKAVKLVAAEQNNPLVTGLSFMFGGKIVEMFVNECLEVDNYGVVSVGRIVDPTQTAKPIVVSVGVLGHVYTASPEVVADHMKSTINKAEKMLGTKISNDVKTGINEAIDGVVSGVSESVNGIVNDVKDEVHDMVDDAVDGAKNRIESEIDNFLSGGAESEK